MMQYLRPFAVLARQCQNKIGYPRTIFQANKTPLQQPCYFSSQTDDLDQIVESICKNDKDLENKLKILMLEVEVMRQDGRYAPDNIHKEQWVNLVQMQTKSQRANYLRYLFKTEKSKQNHKAKKEARKKEFADMPKITKENEDDLLYGIQHQSMFLRIRDQSINQFDNYRAVQAMAHGQSLVIDCSYENDMVLSETLNAVKQLTFVFGDNRTHKQPFNLHLCNLNTQNQFMKQLRKNIPSLDEPWFPMNFHSNSYLDAFPKDKLVYLTPHCREELTKFDHDAVYIIGCMVDKMNNEPLSLARAKRDGIKMAKLPLERYLEWAPGSKKNLNINHMVPILLDLKLTGDWEYALRHVPRRKLMETKIKAMEKKWQSNPNLKEVLLKNNNLNFKKSNMLSFRNKRMITNTFKDKNSRTRSLLYDDERI